MRFVVGCALSLIFSANCAYAMVPVKEAPKKARSQAARAASSQDSLATIDYSRIVTREIQKELKEQAAAPKTAASSALESPRAAPAQLRERRQAIILPSHRTFKTIENQPTAVQGTIKAVEIPASSAAGNGDMPGAVAEIY